MWQLAQFYDQGNFGIIRNQKKCVKILKRAVELGCVEAMVFLGYLYDTGRGGKVDKKKAMQLYRIASDKGSVQGRYNFGMMLREDERHEEAFTLLKAAADRGHTHAMYTTGKCYVHEEGVARDLDEAKRWFARAAANGDEESSAVFEEMNASG